MKNIIVSLMFLISLFYSSNSFANWTKLSTNKLGDVFYVDFTSIKKVNEFIYVWSLDDFLEPLKNSGGILSIKTYQKIDCTFNRYKRLTWIFYKTSMGKEPFSSTDSESDKDWIYNKPGSSWEIVMKRMCNN